VVFFFVKKGIIRLNSLSVLDLDKELLSILLSDHHVAMNGKFIFPRQKGGSDYTYEEKNLSLN